MNKDKVVLGKDDVVILKQFSAISDEFDTLIAEARRQGKKAGLKKSHITAAITRVRGRK